MESDAIEKMLESVAAGKTTPAEALLSLKKEPFTDSSSCLAPKRRRGYLWRRKNP